MQRREFFKNTLLIGAGLTLLPNSLTFAASKLTSSSKKMVLRYKPYDLELKHTFTIAKSSRTHTPVVLTEIEYDGVIGYGEASMPPYLGESQESVINFLKKVDLSKYENPFDLETILSDIDKIEKGNKAAKASIDIALHDLIGKLLDKPLWQLFGFNKNTTPNTSFTIGIAPTEEEIIQKTKEASEFKILKIKIGKDENNDRLMVNSIRKATDVPFCVDVNEGWKDKNKALDMIHWLKEKGCVFVEQPMHRDKIDDIAWLTENSPLPIIADEAFQRLEDLKKCYKVYSGINIKLMKSTGIREALKMLYTAKSLDMKVMIGCMTETSCAISAAAQLSPLCDWADLDGALLIKNDVYDGMKVIDGKVTLNNLPGIGIKKL
ncbi:MAG TPA: dipeptide epimerase [Ignavibacteriales bacterium]|nr:dipeptide epimerase [Ignavibacteriales bacterium]HOL81175.1 dipeptide epimerase [Ignavibacteriales bacterium]HOM65278.1 dipeptide epimerase [Ignavibacteriales bacterium]HPD66570.1 dipeptide epimerase [Ignavibacteriales bacterium]HRR18383.1 dipeptide epimerase [Ignavibacteriales bacterium]